MSVYYKILRVNLQCVAMTDKAIIAEVNIGTLTFLFQVIENFRNGGHGIRKNLVFIIVYPPYGVEIV